MSGSSPFALLAAFASLACSAFASAPEPVCWADGGWDESGAPEGKLLSDNEGWWGESVFTGVTYSYADAPGSPADVLGSDRGLFGRRLLDGDQAEGWHRPVGMGGKKAIEAIFDFKRPCGFREVVIFSSRTRDAQAEVFGSRDGNGWHELSRCDCRGARTRIRLKPSRGDRYLKLRFKAEKTSATYLDEVMVWGEAEVSPRFPENIAPVPRGDYLRMSAKRNGSVRIAFLRDPTDDCPEKAGMPPFSFARLSDAAAELPMARNETETLYLAVVNETEKTVKLPISAETSSKAVKAELLVGGAVRVQPPKYKLNRKQLFDLQLTGDEPEGAFDPGRLGVIPFFAAGEVPPENFAAKYLANPEQVAFFPDAVEVRPGEGAVLMLRVKTCGAPPGRCSVAIRAGASRRDLRLRVVDAVLPESDAWIFAWGQFTRQFPFESTSRIAMEAMHLRELGVTMFQGLPEKGGKVAKAAEGLAREKAFYRIYGVPRELVDKTYRTKGEKLTGDDRAKIDAHLAKSRAEAEALGVAPGQIVLEISDEPGARRAEIFGDVCRHLRKAAADMRIYVNPCFWTGKGFSPAEEIIDCLAGFYLTHVDVSVPYRSLVEDRECREALWTNERLVNAQYAHPAHRAGRSIAWASFRYGLDGFAYWAYFSPRGNPWDIRTWKYWSYECQLVFPLERSVAITPVYEEMREAAEDWRLLQLLRLQGKTRELERLLAEFASGFDEEQKETARPYGCDFRRLREKALRIAATSK